MHFFERHIGIMPENNIYVVRMEAYRLKSARGHKSDRIMLISMLGSSFEYIKDVHGSVQKLLYVF